MLKKNLRHIQMEIAAAARRAGRSPSGIRLVAVTKTVGPDEIREAAALGLRDFGENRLQEAKPKLQLFPELRWHFIGHLQTNKVKEVLNAFSLIHSLDRFSLARELQRRAERLDTEARCLVQLNISGEKSKFGLSEVELPDFLEAMHGFSRIKIEGLMTMAPYCDDPAETRPIFRRLRELQEACARPGMELKELSMGMTNDYTVAVEEGATLVRIGTALFGKRTG
ncbi:MAG TPA: YggS family pyridoxal phosphate-dependent enzyme [Bacillota bacterium]|jgi:pyridoxal phosphate enzyme (YggS family)|nr:YggS family pyridoxal phosphate-dependent enzyme [Bacillota bacterium]HOA35133.1 YggS family pyridoxal phosphate-dependent enzyme [Bacillota bacterium]HPZ11633.1 YggS family pyridoxal phosphate-dependent enzyme [Bacillota bacterium]HQE09486.1 YggS family pyridoxal phosphate-dependent enzyme [Bacillota bacterium]